jgi:Uma2 family endonuclease
MSNSSISSAGESSRKNLDLAIDVGIWNRQTNLGEAFDSSGGYDFTALDGGKPAPDVSWIEKSRLEGVNIVGFIPVCYSDSLVSTELPLSDITPQE